MIKRTDIRQEFFLQSRWDRRPDKNGGQRQPSAMARRPRIRPSRRSRRANALRTPGLYFAESTRVLAAEYSTTLRKVRRRPPHDAAGHRARTNRRRTYAGRLRPERRHKGIGTQHKQGAHTFYGLNTSLHARTALHCPGPATASGCRPRFPRAAKGIQANNRHGSKRPQILFRPPVHVFPLSPRPKFKSFS